MSSDGLCSAVEGQRRRLLSIDDMTRYIDDMTLPSIDDMTPRWSAARDASKGVFRFVVIPFSSMSTRGMKTL